MIVWQLWKIHAECAECQLSLLNLKVPPLLSHFLVLNWIRTVALEIHLPLSKLEQLKSTLSV